MSESPEERRKREARERFQARVGLASNVLGLTAGGFALKDALDSPDVWGKPGAEVPARPARKITPRTRRLAIAAVGLQGANLAGDAVANRVLARSSREKEGRKATPARSHAEASQVGKNLSYQPTQALERVLDASEQDSKQQKAQASAGGGVPKGKKHGPFYRTPWNAMGPQGKGAVKGALMGAGGLVLGSAYMNSRKKQKGGYYYA